jgi:hypothetical protein
MFCRVNGEVFDEEAEGGSDKARGGLLLAADRI